MTQTELTLDRPDISTTAGNLNLGDTATIDRKDNLAPQALAVLRILLGTVFLWAFVDKSFGFGFATPAATSWIAGGSPTKGYLGHLEGWFAGPFSALAGNPLVDVLFMGGLLLLGVALILGVGLRVAAAGGTLLMLLMWLTALPLQNNPVIDEHVIYAAAMIALATTKAGETWGLGRQWEAVLQKAPWRMSKSVGWT